MATSDLNYDMMNYLQEMLNAKTTELEMTAEYGLDLSQKNEKLTNENLELQNELVHHRTAVRSLEGEVNTLRIKIAQLEDENNSMTPRGRSHHDDTQEIQQQLNNQNQQQQVAKMKQLMSEIKQGKDDVVALESEITEARERESWLKGQVVRLKDSKVELEEDMLRLQEDNVILQQQLEMATKQQQRSNDSGLREEIECLRTDKSELKDRVSTLLKQIDQMAKQLEDLQENESQHINRHLSFAPSEDIPENELAELDNLDHDLAGYDEDEANNDNDNDNDNNDSDNNNNNKKKSAEQLQLEANLEAARHLVDKNEVEVFANYLNRTFANDNEVKHKLPIQPTIASLYHACRDGVILCKLVNKVEPNTIDERVINQPTEDEEAKENFALCIDSCRAVGCQIAATIEVNNLLDASDVTILTDLIWSILKASLDRNVSLTACPELSRVGGPDESVEDLSQLSPEQLLLRWVNFILKDNESIRRVKRFDEDLTDCEVQALLLQQLLGMETSFLREYDMRKRVEDMLNAFEEHNKDKDLSLMTSVGGILDRNPNLLYAMLANLFKMNHGLTKLTKREETEISKACHVTTEFDDNREAKVFTLWINSLGIEDIVHNIFDDLRDGLILLKVFDKLNPGAVDWKSVATKRPIPKFMKLQNCNYVVKLCKVMQFSLVGIAGDDIESGSQKMTLAVVWQMMAYHIQSLLQSLSKTNKPITDVELIAWANGKVKESGSDLEIKSFKDSRIKDGLYFLALMNGLRPNSVQKNLIKYGSKVEDHEQNAKYAISVSRKLGAHIFVCVEDIVNVRAKMMFTWVAALMAAHTKQDLPQKPTLRRPITLAPAQFKKMFQKENVQLNGNGGLAVPKAENVPMTRSNQLNRSTSKNALNHATQKQVKALESQVSQILEENKALQKENQKLCMEIGKLKAQVMGQFVAAARTRTTYQNAAAS